MGRTITIKPVSRVEGHARVGIYLDDDGEVKDTRVQIVELRGFENFCVGRPVEELPRIVTRICGVCPWAHHIASAKATDAVFGVEIPDAARKLRELAYMAHIMHSHLLHFFFLASADFLCEPGTDYALRNVIGLAKAQPELVQKAIRGRFLAQSITEVIGEKAIHPDIAVPGGMGAPLTEEKREQLRGMVAECLEFAQFALAFSKEKIFAGLLPELKTTPAKTGFLGLVGENGAMEFYDGKLRLQSSNGERREFAGEDYREHIGEHSADWTYMKFPYDKAAGEFSMDPDNPVGVYRTNALARVNVCDFIPTALAQKELEEFRAKVGKEAQHTFLYHWARLIEVLYAAERAVELIEDDGILDQHVREKVEPRAARGVGVVEAPRGTLIHDYETDAKGFISKVNLIVGTTHNNAAMNISAFRTARRFIKNGKYNADDLNKIEMSIRAYDPCFSCSTHKMDGSLPVKVHVVDSQGQIIQELKN